ncbi:MAG: AmmeMemoRadiSam system protein A [Betaproteobacteria bacterium]|nr:AmmeMemoRadiSam system protein A [Betaproteobacteria bacterium]
MDPTEGLGQALLGLARNAIAGEFGQPARKVAEHPALHEPGATFVTLTQAGHLRGCIGTLEASRSLAEDVAYNARAAAFRDPRFAPLAAAEWPGTRVEVSLLSATEPLRFGSEAELLAQLRPGEDGLILQWGHHRATFLPQVWETLTEPRQFLMELKRKAGLPQDFWEPGLGVSRYGVAKWREAETPES